MRVPGGYFHVDEIPKDDEEAFDEFKDYVRPYLDVCYLIFTVEYIWEGICQIDKSSMQKMLSVE